MHRFFLLFKLFFMSVQKILLILLWKKNLRAGGKKVVKHHRPHIYNHLQRIGIGENLLKRNRKNSRWLFTPGGSVGASGRGTGRTGWTQATRFGICLDRLRSTHCVHWWKKIAICEVTNCVWVQVSIWLSSEAWPNVWVWAGQCVTRFCQ